MYRTQSLTNYYDEWLATYKEGFVTDITMQKYRNASQWLKRIAPTTRICDLTKSGYQRILNAYALDHEANTVRDFHRCVHAAIMDAVDEGILRTDPGRRAQIRGKQPGHKRRKYLDADQFHRLLDCLHPGSDQHPYDSLIWFIALTGTRFAEACGITPADVDYAHLRVTISKTWNYKSPDGGFARTKNTHSVRAIDITPSLADHLRDLAQGRPDAMPLLFDPSKRIFNSYVNDRLAVLCKQACIPEITVHALRHTHGSILLYAGVSIQAISRRLGHANTTTTQEVYLHVIKEMEERETMKITGYLEHSLNTPTIEPPQLTTGWTLINTTERTADGDERLRTHPHTA